MKQQDSAASRQPVTQRDIAKLLGISRQTVGFALNGSSSVSESTRKEIEDAAKRLGYDLYSNREARMLIAKRYGLRAATGILAILMPPFGGTYLRTAPYFAPYMDGAEEEAASREFDILLCCQRKNVMPRLISQKGVDGVVCVSGQTDGVRQIQLLDLPVVNLGAYVAGVPSLLPDDRAGAALAVKHLVALGHRNIAYLGHSSDARPGRERLDGFTAAIRAAGLPVSEANIDTAIFDQTTECADQAMTRLLERNTAFRATGKPDFTALVCYNDTLAIGAIERLNKAGLVVPRDISVTGFDDTSLQLGFKPSLTSISYSRADMGRKAIELLCTTDPENKRAKCHLFPVALEARESTRAV